MHKRRILLVDDDLVVLTAYREALVRQGHSVETATDGIAALGRLKEACPDILVLDLMMPRLSGEQVLKFIRADPAFRDLPVIIFSNAYLGGLTHEAANLGISGALLKSSCTPRELEKLIQEILENHQSAVAIKLEPPSPRVSSGWADEPTDIQFRDQARERFRVDGKTAYGYIWAAFQGLSIGPDSKAALSEIYRHVRPVTATAGLAGFYPLAQLSMVFEALLFQLIEKPERLDASVVRTLASIVDTLAVLFKNTNQTTTGMPSKARVLIVDDDPVSNRVIMTALTDAQFDPHSIENPITGLQMLKSEPHDLVFLDIEMPNVNGLEFCKKVRRLYGYEKVPVIYVTMHSNFETRAQGILSGGNDLISKPVFPIELAAKAVLHLIRART